MQKYRKYFFNSLSIKTLCNYVSHIFHFVSAKIFFHTETTAHTEKINKLGSDVWRDFAMLYKSFWNKKDSQAFPLTVIWTPKSSSDANEKTSILSCHKVAWQERERGEKGKAEKLTRLSPVCYPARDGWNEKEREYRNSDQSHVLDKVQGVCSQILKSVAFKYCKKACVGAWADEEEATTIRNDWNVVKLSNLFGAGCWASYPLATRCTHHLPGCY